MARVLGIQLYNKTIRHAVDHVKEIVLSEKARDNRCISATGAHGLVYAKRDPKFRDVLNSFYINLPDGMPGVWIGRLKSEKGMKRCYGPEFFRELMIATAGVSVLHFFCGGKEGVAEELKEQCRINFNNTNVAGTYCPPFREMTDGEFEELGRRINIAKADIVWIGLSTPKQEQFAYRLRKYCDTHFIITVGAAFDFHTGKVVQAPTWVQVTGLEWLFRLAVEPKRLYKRYLEVVPLFIYYNLLELITFAYKKSGNGK